MVKKRILLILFVLLLCVSVAAPAFAAEAARVDDGAGLLSDSEKATLLEKLDEISIRQNLDIVVVTADTLGGLSVREYADSYYDTHGFGCGSNRDGLLLLISMENRDWYISTCGYGITAFTDAGISYIGKQISPDLSDGEYAAAFDRFAQLCDEFITRARSGKPYDSGNLPREPLSPVWIVIALVAGFLIAKVIVGGMKGQLKSVRAQTAAASYVRDGSLQLTQSRDLFLFRNITKTARASQSGSSGSSTHRSSSGTTHGGGGGKF